MKEHIGKVRMISMNFTCLSILGTYRKNVKSRIRFKYSSGSFFRLYCFEVKSICLSSIFNFSLKQIFINLKTKKNIIKSNYRISHMQKIKKSLQTLDKYLAFGFDADFCIVRYKMEEFFRKHYGLMAKVLVEEKSYPKEILDFTKREKCFIMNGLILDHKTGYMLKLGENKLVTRAYYGFDRVPHEDLQAKFGNPPKYEHFDPYTCYGEEYMCCLSFLRCYISPLLAHMVHHRKITHNPEQINVKQIVQDAMYAAKRADEIFVRETTVEKRELDNMLFKQNKLKEIFQKLRAKGKVLFLLSNAPLAYNAAVMEFAFGKDWTSLFDFIISEGGKPNFFLPQHDTPFYETENYKKTERKVTELRPHGLYTGGNAKLLEENISRIAHEKSGRILFFGDNYSTDVLAAEKIDHWDGVCIIEELGDVDFGKEYDDSVWGHWQYEETPYGKVLSFWYSYLSQNVAVCTSLVDSIDMINFYDQE